MHLFFGFSPSLGLKEYFVGIEALFQQCLSFGFQSARWTGSDTLSTKYTGRIHHTVTEKGADFRIEPAPIEI